jgi:hypothetical protein
MWSLNGDLNRDVKCQSCNLVIDPNLRHVYIRALAALPARGSAARAFPRRVTKSVADLPKEY